VVQSVMKTDATLDVNQYEFAQRFRVPVHTTLRWVELAFGSTQGYTSPPAGVIAILDATGQDQPPISLPASLVEAAFSLYWVPTGWNTHYDFDQTIVLEPNHDYWLLARTMTFYHLYARQITGVEGDDFTSSIGPLLERTTSIVPWIPVPGQALDFRLIGQPFEVAGVTPPAPSRAGFALNVSPNPSRGTAFVSWSGAKGAVGLMVVDERGRRIASLASTEAHGRWTWSGLADDGSALPAGVYFVRASDASGGYATQRVVRVR
jgi:hypothetical protein